jgi:hypothetical protein
VTCSQECYRDSVARFMGLVHMSVNSTSRVYLQNERRYNYTTPKSFLEQISLYSKLLRQKSSELTGKVARLENGLDKLRSTAEQVKHYHVCLVCSFIMLIFLSFCFLLSEFLHIWFHNMFSHRDRRVDISIA